MKPISRSALSLLAAIAVFSLAAAPVSAQEPYRYTVSILGGIGGSIDESDAGLDNTGFQLGLGLLTESRTHLVLRVGSISFDETDSLSGLVDPSWSYITVAGEYRYSESYYESGMFAGLGAYRVEGTRFSTVDEVTTAVNDEDTAIGLHLGVTGEFDIIKSTSILAELSVHYVFSDVAEIFATAHVGVVFHF